ncbi:TPR-like protein [Phlegmacium glaucopus]|nr:TPR-like protein [Phlegmacium glaucopus]
MDPEEEAFDWEDDEVSIDSESEQSSEAESNGPEPGSDAEQEIEGDFDRLVKKIRLRDGSTSSSTGLLTKDWDFDIEEKEAEFKDDLRAASGVGRKKRKKGRVAGPILSHQVKSLIGDGNQAYVDNDLARAIGIMQEVIRIEPRASAAWTVLAQCYEDMNESQKALQLRIMAAHLRHDAEEWDRLARESKEHGYNQQALYCYRKVYSLDPSNVDALWDRASLAKEIGDFRTARNAFLAILKRFPHDLTVLRELHTILVELSDLSTCATLLQDALTHYITIYPSGQGKDSASGLVIPAGGFSQMDLLLLADLYNVLGQHERAIETIRRGTRWLQGRVDQKYWDLCEDDREYDSEDWPARSSFGEGGSVRAGKFILDPNARHRLAVARIKMGDVEEGKLHANALLSEDILDYSVLFAEIADAYYEREMYAEAKPIYELLGGDPATSSIYILLQTAACMRNVEELREAANVYEHVRLADPSNNDAKMKLAEIYEIMGEPRKALDLVYEVIDSRKKRGKSNATNQTEDTANPANTSLFPEDKGTQKSKAASIRAQNRLTHAQLRALEVQKEKEVGKGYRRLKELWTGMLAGEKDSEREWLVEAEKLIDMFRETRNLFVTSRSNPFRGMFPRARMKRREETEADEDRMASRLQLDLERDSLARKLAKSGQKGDAVDDFRGVSFDDWLRLFMQYCFVLTKQDQYETADEILRHIMVSNAYQAKERQDSIRLALMTCAIAAERHDIVVEQARKLIGQHQFNNEPLRILMASLASGLKVTDSFITSTLQKHLFREMKLSDTAVKNPEILKWNPLNKRYAPTGQGKSTDPDEGGDDDGEENERGSLENESTTHDKSKRPEIPTKENPVIVAIYGQICIAAKSYQSAIFYLLHAYDYCPDDPMICLCLAIASAGRAMQRQSDNRHHLVVQAMAFLSKYRNLRGTNTEGVREVEYNFGRMFHQLGLYSHAVKHYERVLELAEQHKDDHFARETAYNLALIFVFTGATPLADALYRRWLSI